MDHDALRLAALECRGRVLRIEMRLDAAAEVGADDKEERITAKMLSSALHEAASACLLIVEASGQLAAEADAARSREARVAAQVAHLEELLAVPMALLRVGRELLRMMRLAIVVVGRAVTKM